ncbi:DDB1- and CUL4-associated factor 8 [Impatiens glandulifera]|uniref:DDB1- and CUL4-associated factor 8 n=1 Tax=Impatiens glandulifera TaxID=253017 RepID=UPI001FB17372|nr:DDB1- and CUL4-associated factor 8 [Impatiens glandulifera]
MKRKRPGASFDKVDLWKRESGELSPINFFRRVRASEDLILKLDKFRTLKKHRGCVNTISFNENGNILVSGSDDRKVILWDWETGKVNLSFHSGHLNNVFQAKFMPYSDDRSIVTCAADGQVRHSLIQEGGSVGINLLGKHRGQAHKLAIEPGSPNTFYTCGEDGLVLHFDLRTGYDTKLFTCKERSRGGRIRTVSLNSIAIDPRNPSLFAVAGSDEYARLYDIRQYKWDGSSDFGQPINYFSSNHSSDEKSITGLAFSEESELLVSYNNDFIYLFKRDMGWGARPPLISLAEEKIEADLMPQSYKGHTNTDTVKGVSFLGPRCEYVASGSDCGRIFIWRKKGGELIRVIEADRLVVNCVESHPHTNVIASSGIESDIKIWTPSAIEKAVLPTTLEKVIQPFRFHFFPYDMDFGEERDDHVDHNVDGHFDDDEDDDDDDDEDDDDDNEEDDDDDEEDDNDEDDDDDNDEDDDGDDDGGKIVHLR